MSYATGFLFVCLVSLVIAEGFQISFISFMKYGFCFLLYLMTVLHFLILLKEFFNLYFVCIYFYKMHSVCWSLSRVRLFATPCTVARQAPPSMGFSRQEYWSGLPLPSPNADVIRLQKSQIQHSD